MYLILLGTICTALAYMVAVEVMKELSAFTVILTTNLEPVYGIILALIIFGEKEQMNSGFYLGAFIILGTVFLYPVIKRRLKHVQANA
jgi:drug/metabolite transporter (DMT)-like permease